MTAPQADTAVLISNLPDLSDVRLDQDVAISQSELKRIVREVIGDQPATPVSSFNSSI